MPLDKSDRLIPEDRITFVTGDRVDAGNTYRTCDYWSYSIVVEYAGGQRELFTLTGSPEAGSGQRPRALTIQAVPGVVPYPDTPEIAELLSKEREDEDAAQWYR